MHTSLYMMWPIHKHMSNVSMCTHIAIWAQAFPLRSIPVALNGPFMNSASLHERTHNTNGRPLLTPQPLTLVADGIAVTSEAERITALEAALFQCQVRLQALEEQWHLLTRMLPDVAAEAAVQPQEEGWDPEQVVLQSRARCGSRAGRDPCGSRTDPATG